MAGFASKDGAASPREELQTCTIVIRDADDAMARLHNRMPVVLAREDEQAWLDPQLTIPSLVMEILARSAGVPVWLKNSAASLRVARIVAQQPAQAISTPHLAAVAPKV